MTDVTVTVPAAIGFTFTPLAPVVAFDANIGAPVIEFTLTAFAPGMNGQRPPAWAVTGTVYLHDGLHPVGQLTKLRNVQWQEQRSLPGSVTFEVAADDPLVGSIGPTDGALHIVKFTWWRRGRPIVTVGCRVQQAGSEFAVNGTRWVQWQAQPGLMSLLADATVYPETGDVPDTGIVDRWFGAMSTSTGLHWYRSSDWQAPVGYAWSATPTGNIRKGYPLTTAGGGEFAAHDPYWIGVVSPDHSVTQGRRMGFRTTITLAAEADVELLVAVDNYGDMWFRGDKVFNRNPADIQGWKQANSTVIHNVPAGDHVLYIEAENAAATGGSNPMAIIGIVYKLDAHGNRDSVLRITDLTNWVCAAGPPMPGWPRGQVIRQLLSEAQTRTVTGPLQVAAGWGYNLDSASQQWDPNDSGSYNFPIGQVKLTDIITQLCEDGLIEAGFDTVGMRLLVWRRRGKDRSASVQYQLAKDGGTITGYQTTVTAPQFNDVLMQLSGGRWTTHTNTASAGLYGVLENGYSIGSTDSDFTAGQVVDAQIVQNGFRHLQVAMDVSVLESAGGPIPYIDFGLGDQITIPHPDGSGTVVAKVEAITADFTGVSPKFTPELSFDDEAA